MAVCGEAKTASMSLPSQDLDREGVRSPGSLARRVLRGERGMMMVESLVSIVLFSMLSIGVFTAVQTGHIAKRGFDAQSNEENIVRNQIEAVFAAPYQGPGNSYTAITPPAGYTVTAAALTYDGSSTDIEIIRVTVQHNGQTVETFETLRANR